MNSRARLRASLDHRQPDRVCVDFGATSVRGRALGLATFFLWAADFAVTQTFPMLDAPDSWLVAQFHHAFPFYIYAAFCVVLVLVVWRFVPETKGRSLEEIEGFWQRPRGVAE